MSSALALTLGLTLDGLKKVILNGGDPYIELLPQNNQYRERNRRTTPWSVLFSLCLQGDPMLFDMAETFFRQNGWRFGRFGKSSLNSALIIRSLEYSYCIINWPRDRIYLKSPGH